MVSHAELLHAYSSTTPPRARLFSSRKAKAYLELYLAESEKEQTKHYAYPGLFSSSSLYTFNIAIMASSQPSSQSATNYKEAFSLFDKRGNGRVSLDSLGDLLRACGQNPTLAEIRDLEKTVGGDCKSQQTIQY